MARFEGAAKVLVDNKGVTLSGAFGLPPRAHADDARRAITAAETLRRELEDIGLSCTVGVATGRAFCGIFGSDLRREYTLHGEVVNLASRLMQASARRDPVLRRHRAGGARERRLRGAGAGHAEGTRRAGGGAPRNVDAQRRRAARESRMVGREAEQAAIRARIDDLVTDDRSATVVIEGEAGLGKSLLVGEAIRLARARGVRVLTAAADAVENATSYYAWRAMFTDLLEVTPQTMVDPHSLEVPCDPELRRMRPLLSSIVPVGIPDNELTGAMDGSVRAENTKLLLASILRHTTAQAPILVVVEDAHWLDSNSWALLLEVVQSVPRALVAVTTRPMSDPPEQYARLRALGSTELIALEPLSPGEIQTLVKHQLGVHALPIELTGFVDDRVAGHPFFCEQLVQTMREGGLVRVQDGTAVVGDLDTLDVPATIEGAVLSRIDRLTAGQLLCLKVAAVIGRSFLSRTVTATLPAREERAAVPEHLETLARLDLTMRESEHSGARLSLPPRDHARGRLRPADREPEPPAAPRRGGVARAHLQRGRAGSALRAAGPSLGARRRSRQGRHLPRRERAGRRCTAARSTRR